MRTAGSLAQTAPRTPTYDRKLEHVLAAAARVFAREGYGRATIRQVAREAEMSLAGLYYYFASKEELLFLLQFHTFDSIVTRLEAKLESVHDPKERLRLVVANHFEHFLAGMDELKVCVHEMASLEGEYYERVQELRRAYFRITHEIVESIGKASRDSLPASAGGSGGQKATGGGRSVAGPPGTTARDSLPASAGGSGSRAHARGATGAGRSVAGPPATIAGGSKVQSRLATLYLFGMLNWVYMWYPAQHGITDEMLVEQLVTLFLDGYLPRPIERLAVRKGGKAHV